MKQTVCVFHFAGLGKAITRTADFGFRSLLYQIKRQVLRAIYSVRKVKCLLPVANLLNSP